MINHQPVVAVVLHTVPPVYLSDRAFVTAAGDTPPLLPFDARLSGKISWSAEVSCWVWGKDSRGSGLGAIEFRNDDGAFDWLVLAGGVKGARVDVLTGFTDQPLSAFRLEQTAILSDIVGIGEQRVRIVTSSLLDKTRVPLSPTLYADGETPVLSQVGRNRPHTIGRPLSCPIVLVDDVDFVYDVHDSDNWAGVSVVRDNGVVLTPGTGYARSVAPGRYGVGLLAGAPVGKIVADVQGAMVASTIISDADDGFGNLVHQADWTVIVRGAGDVAFEDGGVFFARPSVFDTALIQYVFSLAPGSYRVTVTVPVHNSGSVDIKCSGNVVGTINGLGSFVFVFACAAPGDFVLIALPKSDLLLGSIRLELLTDARRLPDVVPYLLARAGIDLASVDMDSVLSLDAIAPWPVSHWSDGQVSIQGVLGHVMDSYCGWIVEDLGLIRVGRLSAPDPLDSVATISLDEIAEGTEINVQIDTAPGFNSTIAGQPNWYVYATSEIADSLSAADKAMLSSDYRVRRDVGVPVSPEVSPVYRPLSSAFDPAPGPRSARPTLLGGFGTCLDQADDCLALSAHVTALYPPDQGARFYDFTAYLTPEVRAVARPGRVVTLKHPRYGLSAGVPGIVTRIAGDDVGSSLVTITVWLRSPV